MAALKNLNGYEMQNHILNRVFLLINSFKKILLNSCYVPISVPGNLIFPGKNNNGSNR